MLPLFLVARFVRVAGCWIKWGVLIIGGVMRPLRRKGVSKKRSAKKFRKQTMKTKAANLRGVMRGGYRI